jgi:hypothetical protein
MPEIRDDDRFVGTQSRPGSEEKVLVLIERYELGLPLWHPDDRTIFVGTPTPLQPDCVSLPLPRWSCSSEAF